jgi:hypothetical protein
VLQTNGDPLALVPIVAASRSRDRCESAAFQVRTMEESRRAIVERRRWTMTLLAWFAVLALAAAAGIYGVMAHLVSLAHAGDRRAADARREPVEP